MSEVEEQTEEQPEKKPGLVKTLMSGLIAAGMMGGAVAGVVFFLPSEEGQCDVEIAAGDHGEPLTKSYKEVAFVNLEPLVVSLGPNAKAEYLKISISVETSYDHVSDAEHLSPRFRDVLNTYLRAVDESDLVEPAAMTRLRAQMLRRLQVVASSEIVSDLLITDFILN